MDHKRGILFALLASGISGVSILYNKLYTSGITDATTLNILKNGMAAFLITAFLVNRGKIRYLRRMNAVQWKKLVLVGLIGGSIPFVLFFSGLAMIPAANAAFLHKTLFLWVAVLAVPILGERLTPVQVGGYVLVMLGSMLLGFDGLTWSTGELLVLSATLFWAIEQIAAKTALRDIDSTVLSWGRMAIGTLVLVLVSIRNNALGTVLSITPFQLMAIAGSSLFLCGYVLSWYKALKLAPATLVSSVLVLSVPVTTALAAIHTAQTPPTTVLLSSAATALGILLIALSVPDIRLRRT